MFSNRMNKLMISKRYPILFLMSPPSSTIRYFSGINLRGVCHRFLIYLPHQSFSLSLLKIKTALILFLTDITCSHSPEDLLHSLPSSQFIDKFVKLPHPLHQYALIALFDTETFLLFTASKSIIESVQLSRLHFCSRQEPFRGNVQHLTDDHDLIRSRVCMLHFPFTDRTLSDTRPFREFPLTHGKLLQFFKYAVTNVHGTSTITAGFITTIQSQSQVSRQSLKR